MFGLIYGALLPTPTLKGMLKRAKMSDCFINLREGCYSALMEFLWL